MPRERSTAPWLGKEPGRPYWYIYWYDVDGGRVRRRSTGAVDRAEAEERLGLFIIERARSQPQESPIQSPERYDVSTALAWYGVERAPELASAAQAGWAIEHLTGFFRKTKVANITPQLLKRYEAERGKKVKRGTIRRELAVLSAAINHSIKNGRLTSAPKIILPAPGKGRTRTLSESEIRRLLAACQEPHLWLFVMLALNTGARRGALLEMRWEQVDFDHRLIHLNPPEREQTTKGRAIVPMSAPLFDALFWTWLGSNSPFVIAYKGAAISDIKTAFNKAVDRAGLENVSPHILRHTAGTIMARAGIDLWMIANVLGHSVAKTTELYAHARPEWLREAAEVLGRATSFRPHDTPTKSSGA